MKTTIILFVTWWLAFECQAQTSENNPVMYSAYLNRSTAMAKQQWKKIVEDTQAQVNKNNTDKNLHYTLALAHLGLLSATMRDMDENLFDEYVDGAEDNLKKMIAENKNWGEAQALLSAIYGLKIGHSPIKGMFLGPKSSGYIEDALKNSPRSPLVKKLYANSKFHTPETFGGDVKEAIRSYEESIRLYEEHPEYLKSNWIYLDAFAFLGQAYEKAGNNAKAISTYEKALVIEPNYGWIKETLLPGAKKNNASN